MKRMKKAVLLLACLCLLGTIMAGCGKKSVDDVTELTWYVPQVLDSPDFDKVMGVVNEKLRTGYGMNLKLIGIDSGNYSKKLQVMNAGREEYDLAFTSSWTNDFYSNVNNGVCADLTSLLPEYAPKLYGSMQQAVWKAVTVDERIYAVPNWQIQAKGSSLAMPVERLEQTGMNMDDFNTLEDITEYLRRLKTAGTECNKVLPGWYSALRYYGYCEIVGQDLPGAISFTASGKPVVVNQYDLPEFEKYIKLRKSWTDEGLIFNKYLPEDISSSTMEKKEIRQRPFNLHIFKPGSDAESKKSMGYEWKSKQMAPAVLDAQSIMAAMTCVSATGKNPEKAVQLLEIVNTEPEIINLLAYGLEGQHYEKIGEKTVKSIQNSGYTGVSAWKIGSVANTYLIEGQPEDVWEQTETFNENAIVSPILGFNPDTEVIAEELANLRTVINERLTMLDLGLTEAEAGLSNFREELKKAGVDTAIAELQKQIDTWYSKQ